MDTILQKYGQETNTQCQIIHGVAKQRVETNVAFATEVKRETAMLNPLVQCLMDTYKCECLESIRVTDCDTDHGYMEFTGG